MPAGQWAPFPTPPRRSRWKLWASLGALFVVVSGCATFVGIKAWHAGSGADHAVNAFLDAAQRGDTTAALAHACPEATSADVPDVRSHHVRGIQVTRGDGRTTAQVTVTIVLADGTEHRDLVLVEKDGDRWLVCGVQRLG